MHLFYVFPYSNWLAWFAKIQNVFLTFGWNYMDIFLMLLGIGLSNLLARITEHLQCVVQQVSAGEECGSLCPACTD